MGTQSRICLIVLVCYSLLFACSNQGVTLSRANQQEISIKQIELVNSSNRAPWKLALVANEQQLLVDELPAQFANGKVMLDLAAYLKENDALQLHFNEAWSSGTYFTNGSLDLRDYRQEGTLEFDLKIDQIEKGKLDLIVNCEMHCTKAYRLREWAQTHQQQGWQHLSIDLSCLIDEADDLSHVRRPFQLSTGGEGQIAFANVRFKAQGHSNMPCPSAIELATTPSTLNEYWSVEWWLPRHNQKVAQAKQGSAELIMIGDSITHGWENEGKEVWNKHFADIKTLNLGYSGDRTENVIWRLQHGELGNTEPALVVMMIGTNNTGHRMDSPQAIAAGVTKIVDELQQQLPQAKILLLEIFPRDAEPDSAMRLNNQVASDLIAELAKKRGLLFANFNADFLSVNGTLTKEMMPDLLHPKALGYEIWAKQLRPFVDQYVRKKE
ncbi:MAG: putative glycoside hydrolase [Paraglaciecola sp.]|nr:putative glycoside hydrolase [Paraglaciecola sp.]